MHAFFEVFQLVKLEKNQISLKKVEFEILLTQPHNHDRLGWPYDPDRLDWLDDTNGSSRPNNQDGLDGPNDLDGLGDLMTHTGRCRAGPTTQTDQVGPAT